MGVARAPRDRIGPRIGVLREQHGFSHSDLVRRAKVSSASLSNYESGNRRVPAEVVERVADALGVSICALYGRDEGHQAVVATTLAEQLAQVMGVEPGRVEVNVYPKVADDSRRESAAAPATEFVPTRADRDTRDILRAWPSMTDEQRQEWLDFADEIRREKGTS